MLSSISFDFLLEEICVDTCSKVFADSTDPIKDITKLESVSKSFQRLCDNAVVLHNFPFDGSPFGPYYPFNKYLKYLQIYHKCLVAKNPVVMYREGFMQYFIDQQPRGLEHLTRAANMGIEEAEFFYAVILLCLGGEGKKKAMELSTSFVKRLLDNNIFWLRNSDGEYWLIDIMLTCQPMVKHLIRSYVRDQCNCDGLKEGLVDRHGLCWQCDCLIRSRTLMKLISASSCHIRLSHHVFQLFFDMTEE